HHTNPRTAKLGIQNTPKIAQETKTNVVKRVPLRRTLQYSTPAGPEPVDDSQAVLERIISGQMLRSNPSIVGRDQEHQIVRDVLKGDAKQGASLFIIGPPGTGKTSSVNELLSEQGTFTDPAVLYAAVAQLVKKATSWKVPELVDPFEMDKFVALQRRGSRAKKHSVVVVLDEVDQLLRLPVRMQPIVKEVLHFFVRWAAVAPHDIKFLGIMNGVDMYEQVSRVHVTGENAVDSHVPRVVFGSYSHQDLLMIMQCYVRSALPSNVDVTQVSKFIEPRAIELIARKVAARDGDARLAIICPPCPSAL
ncbi:Cdc6, partial [Phytophthora palmivora]